MSIQLACTTSVALCEFRRPKCPHCGSVLLIAEESTFNWQGHISHFWSCDDCTHEFVTSIPLQPS
jgi:hypothetical protein